MIDPTQTQPLSWRMHQGQATPWEEVPMETRNRQAPRLESPPPERLSDRGYRLRVRLGSGRLGAVYEAQDDLSRSSGSQHFVAIQLIDEAIASRPGFAADFERGASELRSLSHPNIVKLLEYGRDQNRFYLVNELLESASVRFVLSDVTELPLEEATAVLRAVGDALQYLHAKSIVHGNVRPENVLVTFGYEVKLLDIVPAGWLENPADELGVPARQPNKRDDVFGLACLAYEMLAGRHPFNGNSAQEAYRAGLESAPIATLTPHQWNALSRALAVHRDDRTPSVAQFLDEFGVTGIERLRSVVSAGPEARPSPVPAQTLVTHRPSAPLLAERAAPAEPERRGIAGKLFFLLVLTGLGALAWVYLDPLRMEAGRLLATIDARLQGKPAAAMAEANISAPDARLAQAAPVTDPEPALVLAPGATAPATENATADPVLGGDQGSRDSIQAEVPRAAPVPVTKVPDAAPVLPAPVAEAPVAAPGVTRFSFAQPVAVVRENEVAARIVIRRTGDARSAASIAWWTSNGSAVAGDDYADLGARVERFEPGEQSRTVYVPLTNDSIAEPTKSFDVHIGRGEAAGDNPPLSSLRVDIVDDD
jgi:hypothetical protein